MGLSWASGVVPGERQEESSSEVHAILIVYRITRNFRENLIFAIFANDLKTRKYVSAENCTLKESLEVGTGIIFCCSFCYCALLH